MSFHKDQLFFDGSSAVSSPTSVDLQVGPGTYNLTANVSALTGNAAITVLESADDSTYVALATFKPITKVGVYHRKVQTRLEYLRMTVTPGTNITLVAGPTIGSDAVANE
jgi:hypothetical protein